MRQLLPHVTPLTVGTVLAVLLVAAFCLVLRELRSPSGLPQGLLAASTLLFLLVLVAPLGQWERAGTAEREVEWNPAAGIGVAFLEPGTGEPETHEEHKASGGTEGALRTGASTALLPKERLLHLLLFVPIGVLAFYSFSPWWARLFYGPALSAGIEAAQWALAAGRTAETAAVVLNTAGSLTGTAMAGLSLSAALWAGTAGPVRSPSPAYSGAE